MSDDECLDPNLLVDLTNGRASDADKARIEAHVARCEDCMQLMIDMGRAVELADGSPYSVGVASKPHGDELSPGDVVDHFQVERLLGRGGMGEVYRAHDVKLGRTVALKLIHPTLMTSTDAKRRFENEARATAKLNHPNIVNIHAVGEHRGRPYVALEYLEGRNLREQLVLAPPDLVHALETMLSISEAVAAAHSRGVVHRDLKPENVIVDSTGRVRVVDFGLARIGTVTEEGVPASVHGAHLTTIGGTPLYMAPEQWRLAATGAPADIWAIGVMLFEIVARRHPFHDYKGSDLDALKQNVEERAAPALGSVVNVPPALSELVARCLDKNADLRPRASEVVGQLRLLLEDAPRVPSPPSSLFQHRRASRRATLVASGALVVAVGAVVWGWQMSRSLRAPSSAIPSTTPVVVAVEPSESHSSPVPEVSATAAPVTTSARVRARTVKPDPNDACTETADCRNSGHCHDEGGACVVRTDADCRESTNCKTFGNCVMKSGRCVPTTAAHCRNASRCASWGMCTLTADRCTATSAEDCRVSTECKAKGACTPSGGWCLAQSDADCQASALCQSQSRCRLDPAKGQCVK